VKDIQANLNLLTAKNESLKDTTVEKVRNDLGWTVAGEGRKEESLQLTLCGAQPIPVTRNRFEPHDNLMNHELDTFNLIMPMQRNRTNADKKRLKNRKKHKILITGNSHSRDMTAELQHNRDKNFGVQGVVKPSSDLLSILNPGIEDTKDLTKNDITVVLGGTRDVSENETDNDLSQIRTFVKMHSKTNILVLELPDRYNLNTNSCVNREGKVSNRKLSKYMKAFEYTSTVEVYYSKNH
jgi:hypothetical protein